MTFDTQLSFWIIVFVTAVYSLFKGSNFLFGVVIIASIALILSPSVEAEEFRGHKEETIIEHDDSLRNSNKSKDIYCSCYLSNNWSIDLSRIDIRTL